MQYMTYEAGMDPPHVDGQSVQAIRVRAYELWEEAGRPEGVDASGGSWADHFWFQAERQLFNLNDSEDEQYIVSMPVD